MTLRRNYITRIRLVYLHPVLQPVDFRFRFPLGWMTPDLHLLPLLALVGVGRNLEFLLQVGDSDVGEPGLGVPLSGDCYARAMIVSEELLHLVPSNINSGLCEPDPGLRVNMVLGTRVLLHLVIALKVDAKRVRHLAVELSGLGLDDEVILRFFKEDRKCKVRRISRRK